MISTVILLILSARSIDLSALERASSGAGTELDSLSTKLLWAGVLVGIGVLIECWPDALEFWHELRWPMAGFPHGKLWPLVGGMLVAIGVIGEFWYTGKISSKETELRQDNQQIEDVLNGEAQKARLRADETEKKLLELQRATLPRTLNPKRVASKIDGFGQISTASCVANDFEPQHTFALIEYALELARWKGPHTPTSASGGDFNELSNAGVWIEVSPMAESSPGPHEGITIKHSPMERAKELRKLNRAAEALVSALNAEGVETKKRPLSAPPNTSLGECPNMPDAIRILVGLRPMPTLLLTITPDRSKQNAANNVSNP
jgi:hypothetical protein